MMLLENVENDRGHASHSCRTLLHVYVYLRDIKHPKNNCIHARIKCTDEMQKFKAFIFIVCIISNI